MSTRKRRSDADFDRELRSHLQLETDRLFEEGLTPDEAERLARRRLGNLTLARERYFEAGRLLWLDTLRQDVRGAWRSLRRYPVAAVVAILSLAAGIGATTVTLTIRSAVFHKAPRAYRDPDRLSRILVGRANRPLSAFSAVPAPLFQIWRAQLGPSLVGATPRTDRDVRTADRTATVGVHAASPELFTQLGVAPVTGTTFTGAPASDAPPVVLSYQLWQRLFDGRADVAGQPLWIDGQPYTVAGVLPASFWFGDMFPAVWTELDIRTVKPDTVVDAVARRDASTTPAALEASLRNGLTEYTQQLPAGDRQWHLLTASVKGTPLGHQVSFVLPYVLAAAVLLTLLIACANVAILMIAQWTAREYEIAIRASIGASRARIVRSLLTESVLVSALGGLLGVLATFILTAWIAGKGDEAQLFDVSMDFGILVQTAAVAIATGLVAGLWPALYETRRLHTNPLRAMGGSDRVRQRLRHALVVFEIAVTVALLVQTTAMVDGYLRTNSPRLGYDTASLMVVRVDNPGGVPIAHVLERLRSLPGVAAAAASTTVLPFASRGELQPVSATSPRVSAVTAGQTAATPGFFDVLGVRLQAGRTFDASDSGGGRAAILNETLGRELFGGRNAVGARIWVGDTDHDVVGVVTDYSSNPLRLDITEPKVFVPMPLVSPEAKRVHFLVRAQIDPAGLVQTVRREIPETASATTVSAAWTVNQVLDVSGREILVGTAPLFPLIFIGVMLTATGVYGVLAFALARRGRELAVRVAVGAGAPDLIRLVAAHTVRLVLLGVAIGLAVTFGLSRVVRAGGGAGSVFDPPPMAFLLPIAIVTVIGLVATWIPARRVLKIDPVVLLKAG